MIGRTYLERGKPVTVIVRWNGRGPRNVLIRHHTGILIVRPFRGLRRPAPAEDGGSHRKEQTSSDASPP